VRHKLCVLCYSDENGVLDAATKGALQGIQLVLGITANLIAFVSFIAFLNGVLSWLGNLVGVETLTLEVSCTSIMCKLNPSLFMGTD
jgi:pyrimidine nucleoside transport protein